MARTIQYCLEPEYNFDQIENLNRTFKKILEEADQIYLDVQHLKEINLSLMQVIISFAYECEKNKIPLFITNSSPSHPLRIFSEKIGFVKLNFL